MRAGRTLRRASFVAALAAVVHAGCTARKPDRITLGTVPLPALGLFFIAEQKGYLRAHGVAVEQRRFSSGRDALVALGRGEVDAALAFETPVALRASVDRELDVVTTLHTSTRSARLVARADRGIRRDADLAGKRVGVPRDTTAESFLHALVEYSGLPRGAIQLVDVAPDRAAALLASGELDAVAIWPPHSEEAKRLLGEGGSVEIFADVYTEISMLVTRAPVLARSRGALVKLVRALADAETLAREHPEEAFRALSAALPEQPAPQLREAWQSVRPVLGITHLLAQVLENEWDALHAEGRVSGVLDLRNLLDPDVLAEVDPEALTFVLPSALDAR
jgi:ABC-type nitrate/sulfonate/bicarbonate transport system substrate-binding protein